MSLNRMRDYCLGLLLSFALVLAACAPGGQTLPQDPLLRSLERKSGLIVYLGADGNIYTIDQGGGNKKAVTTDGGTADGQVQIYQFPTWSPDGSRLAFAKLNRASGGAIESASLLTAAPDGSALVETFTSEQDLPIFLYWSPDSEYISFISTTASGAGALKLQLAQAGGGGSQLLDVGTPYFWNWAPDGKSLLAHVGGPSSTQSPPRLSFLNLGDEVIEEVLQLSPATFQAPAWSPDGRQLLLAAETDDGAEALMVTDSHGAMDKVLTQPEGRIAFGWSPDGRRIAYIQADPEIAVTIGTLTVLDPDDPASAKTTEQESVVAFFWSPDSRMLAYFVLGFYTPEPEAGQTQQPQPVLLLQLYVMDVESGDSHEVTTFRPGDSFTNLLPYFDQYQHAVTIWSPDSKNLVLAGTLTSSETGARAGVWVVAASGNLEPRYLDGGELAFWSWK